MSRTFALGLSALAGAAIARVGVRSGARDAEVRGALPGDELVAAPRWQSTRAITVRAAPADVWPWVVQMGFPTYRAGWYTPFWLDHLMWGIEARSSERIVPELQSLAVGERVPDSPDCSVYFTVARVEPGRALVLHSTRHLLPPYRAIDFSWAFVLADHPRGSRLLIRARADYEPAWPAPATWLFVRLVLGPGDFVNASAMLTGIRRRVARSG
jgi:hypothetical protein